MMPPYDPARLANAGQSVRTHARFAEGARKFRSQERHGAVRLFLALESRFRSSEGIHRILDVRHVHDGSGAAGETHRETIAPDHPVVRSPFANTLRHFGAARFVRFVEILDDDHLRPVDDAFGRLAALETS